MDSRAFLPFIMALSIVLFVGLEGGVSCGEDETLIQDVCLPESCVESGSVCSGLKRGFSYECSVDGGYDYSVFLCGGGEVCSGGGCVLDPNITGGSLSDWDSYANNIAGDGELSEYLLCRSVFDCDTLEVSLLAGEIYDTYSPETPREYMDSASIHINQMIDYEYTGGNQQCGETASSLISRYYAGEPLDGNCVDYSTVLISILRHEGIPSRQVAGCVDLDSRCNPFSVVGVERDPLKAQVGLGICGDNVCGPEEEDSCPRDCSEPIAGVGYAHSYLEAYTPEYGFQTLDPTIGLGLSACIGYEDIEYGGAGGQLCYLPPGTC